MSNEFEKALDAFLEGADADEAHQALYDIIRAAFLAGWRSAGGDPPQEQKLFELIPGGIADGRLIIAQTRYGQGLRTATEAELRMTENADTMQRHF